MAMAMECGLLLRNVRASIGVRGACRLRVDSVRGAVAAPGLRRRNGVFLACRSLSTHVRAAVAETQEREEGPVIQVPKAKAKVEIDRNKEKNLKVTPRSQDFREAESKEHLWKKYFKDSSQWVDNTIDKKNPRAPDFKHKVTGEALWIANPSTPQWVKAMLKEGTQGGRDNFGGSEVRGLKSPSQFNRLLKDNNGKGYSQPTSTREWRRAAPADNAHKHLQNGSAASESVAILINRVHQGFAIDSYTYVDVLQRCFKQKDHVSAKQVHDCIRKSGLEQNPYVANNLLKCYIRCGRLKNARDVFNKLMNKDVVSWTIMIGGYAEHDQAKDAIEVYNQMRNEGGQPNAITYLSALKACVSPIALKWGKEIHAHIIHDGFQADVRVGNALVNMYAKSGSLDDARMIFDEMVERDVISWNAMIGGLAQHGRGHEAFSLFHQMQRAGFTPNSNTYLSILSARASTEALEWVKEVHSHAAKSRLAFDLRVNNALIHMYARCGSIDDAKLVFDSMMNRDVISWTVMIGGLAQHGRGHDAFSLFHQMQREGFVPNSATYLSILSPNAGKGALEWVKEVHSHAIRSGLDADLRLGNALIHMYAKSGSIEDARVVFDRMVERNVISWTVMIGGLAQYGLGHEAFSLFSQMQREGFTPNPITYVSILNPCSSTGALEWVKEVHAHAIKVGLDVDLRVGNALVHMYAKIGSIDDARLVFDKMVDRDVFSWTVIIGGLAQHGHGREALQLFEEMKSKGVKPDGSLFVAVLSACSHAGLADEGRFQFVSMKQDYGIEPALEHYNCMVDILGRAGHLEEAKLFILNMPIEPDIATWGALLGACRTYDNLELAELAAKACLKLEPMNPSTYVLLSNIYAAAGKWDQVSLVRSMMQERGLHKEPGRSWIEIDNKIHHFLVGDTSHPEAKEIYAMLNSLSEKLKAEGYIPDTRLVLRNIGDEDKEEALCSHSEKLAIAYGLMHVARGKPIRVYKNLRVCTDCHTATKFISKVTGREIVARDANRFHHFKDGVCSCGDYW